MDAAEHAGFAVEEVRGCVVVVAVGELDLQTSEGLHDALTVAGEFSHRIIVDLTRVTLMDSTSLAVLESARKQTVTNAGALVLVGPPDIVRKVLSVTRLDERFPIHAELATAVTALTEPKSRGTGDG